MPAHKIIMSCSVAAIVSCLGSQAVAQSRVFDIPAQAAVTALPEFARQAEIQIIAPAADLEALTTPAITGEMEAREALTRLLAGTSLEIASDDGGVITLKSGKLPDIKDAGSVTGSILNPITGEYMRDARIRIVDATGRQRLLSSGERGEFRIAGVSPGPAEVVVSFTGYSDYIIRVEIKSGQTSEIEVPMRRRDEDPALMLGQVVVIGDMRDGDARAIMRQRQSVDIMNSLSSESFGDIAEGNVGEFLKYMPGVDTEGEGDDTVRYVRLRGLPPEYTSITVNGVNMAAADANGGSSTSRSFSFEQVSLSSVDAIEISKTVSADVDANAPAGTINLRTKRAFDRKGRKITAQLSGYTHSDLWHDGVTGPGEGRSGGKIRPNGQIEYSDVFFSGRLGIVASVSQSNTRTEMEQTYYPRSYVPTAASPEPMAPNTIYAHMRSQEVSRFASSFTADYRATDDLILSLATIYNQAYLWSGQRTHIFTTGARTYGVDGNAMLDFTTQKPESVAGVSSTSNAISKRGEGLTVVPSFEFSREGYRLDGNLSYSDSTSDYDPLGDEGSIFNLVNAPVAGGNFSVARSGLGDQDWNITQVSGGDWSDPQSYTQGGAIVINSQDGRSASTELTGGALNLTVDSPFKQLPVTFKTGVKVKRAVYDYGNERAAHQYRYIGSLSPAEFLSQNASVNELVFNDLNINLQSLSGSSQLYMPSNYKIGQLFLSNPELFQHTLTAANYYTAYIANHRHFEEDTNAAYVMATTDFSDRLLLRAGLRWEETKTRAREFDALSADEVRSAGYAVSASTGRATTIEGLKYQYETRPQTDREGTYDYFFPSASLKFSFDQQTDLQVGYSRTIRRPEVNQLAGVWSVDDATLTVTAPNPGLEPELSDNISVRIARYFEPVGLLAVNYFQNNVTGLFQTEEMTAAEFGYSGTDYSDYTFRTTRTVDGEAISIRGVEVEAAHSMDYLPGYLSGVTLRGAYTHTAPEIPIAGSAENFASLAIAYKRGPVSLNLNTVWTGEKLNSVSTGSFIDPRTDMSLSGSYAVHPGWRLFFSMRNLLDQNTNIMLPGVDTPAGPIGDHAGDYRAYGRSATFGVRATF